MDLDKDGKVLTSEYIAYFSGVANEARANAPPLEPASLTLETKPQDAALYQTSLSLKATTAEKK